MTQYKKLKLDNKTCIRLLDIVDEFVEGNRKVANEMLDRLYEEQQKEDTNQKTKTMEQKDKDLLLKDICGRLPYDIIVRDEYGDYIEVNIYTANLEHLIDRVSVGIVKMVLRPLSSMTEEEKRELQSFFPCSFGNQYLDLDKEKIELYECNSTMEIDLYDSVQIVDFCKKNHLDYYGLIKKGLALSTDEFNPYKK